MYMSKRLVRGVGINDADHKILRKENGKTVWRCPFYVKWMGMLMRCYSTKYQVTCPTYKGCSVSIDWLTFSNFKRWMETQAWEGKALDKDLLVQGNKVYSSDTCLLVDSRVNSLLTGCGRARGVSPLGVYYDKAKKEFRTRCRDRSGKQKNLGYFTTPEEAHKAYCKYKAEVILEVASEESDQRLIKALHKISAEIKEGVYYVPG